MAGETQNQDWFTEFKKVSGHKPDAAGTPPAGKHERRRFHRFDIHDATVKLYRRGATAIFGLARLSIEGVVLDLSEGGLRFETNEQFLIDTKIHLKVTVAKFNDSVEMDGLTRWCHADPRNEEKFTVGVQFNPLDPVASRKLAQMRGWYTSAQYKAIRDAWLREQAKKKLF